MLYVLAYIAGLITSAVTLLILLLRIKRRYLQVLQSMQEVHKKEWQEMIGKVHHAQAVPPGTRILGIVNLLFVALTRIIDRLQKQQEKQDFNNAYLIQEIQEVILVELQMLKKSIGDWLHEVRNSVKPYEDKQ